jgi:NADH-quinone oxidoreductase subunit N
MLAGVVVSTQLGVRATVFYLAAYLFMNMAAFSVILARERETSLGDSLQSLAGLASERPLLAWPMTLAMLGLAGIPATIGFVGKFYLIDAAAANGYTWLGVAIVIGSMISLGYYLPVIAAMWMREVPAGADGPLALAKLARGGVPGATLPAIAGGSPELDDHADADADADATPETSDDAHDAPSAATAHFGSSPEVVLVATVAGAAILFFGIVPGPLFDLVRGAGNGLGLF